MPAASPPLLSIIIVAYKSRDEIGDCLASLPAELSLEAPLPTAAAAGTAAPAASGPALARGATEVIVVDNSPGAAHGVGEIVRARFPQVRLLAPGENLGFGRANNLGFRHATGECVLFLNPDTVCNRAALEHCVRRVRAEPALGLISPRLVLRDGSMDLACRRGIPTLWDGFCRASGLAAAFPRRKLFAGYNLTHLPDAAASDVGAINGAFMLGRREVFLRVAERARDGGPAIFDEQFFMYGDDLDLCIRVARAGWRIVYDGRVQITHVKGVSVAKDYDAMARAIFDANRDVYLKHFNPRGSVLVRWKYTAAFALWKRVALLRARWRGSRRVRPA